MKGWHNADDMSIGLQANDTGWTPKITLGRGYYRKYPTNWQDFHAPCTKPSLENEACASFNQNRQPTDPDPDVQLTYTNVANMLRLVPGSLVLLAMRCSGRHAGPELGL